MRKKIIIIAAALALVVVVAVVATMLLRKGDASGNENKVIDPPLKYKLGDVTLPALPILNEEAVVYAGRLSDGMEEAEMPETTETADAASDADAEETAVEAEAKSTAVTYTYEGLTDACGMIRNYAGLLTNDAVGFQYVDETIFPTVEPVFEAGSGSALLAKTAPEEGYLLTVDLEWYPEGCVVTVDNAEGAFAEPAVAEDEEATAMTLQEAEDYMRSLPPSTLGLDGTSMDEYNVYSLDGAVLINGEPCLRMNVYSSDDTLNTNEIQGEYFINADGSHIYRLDTDGTVVQVTGTR